MSILEKHFAPRNFRKTHSTSGKAYVARRKNEFKYLGSIHTRNFPFGFRRTSSGLHQSDGSFSSTMTPSSTIRLQFGFNFILERKWDFPRRKTLWNRFVPQG
jgi:hypothetical protein